MVPAIILAISAFFHFIHFGFPASVVFDEVYYGNFASNYWQGNYFFDIHPPLVKLLYAFVGKIIGISNQIADWSTIGNTLPEALVELRVVPMIAGTILPIIIYAICRRLNFSKTASFVAGILVCLENSLLVQSRFILPDIIMLVFGFSSILFYLEYTRRIILPRSSLFFALSAIFASFAVSIKWTSLTFFLVIFFLEIYRLYEDGNNFKTSFKKITYFIFKYVVILLAIYISFFAIHFTALPYSGKGDVFMTDRFQKSLAGSKYFGDPNIEELGFVSKFLELNKVMFTSNQTMTATHPYSSKWYSWPVMQKPVFYWQDKASPNGDNSYIYLFGNPFIYWLGTFVIFMLALVSIFKFLEHKQLIDNPENSKVALILIVGYFTNIFPFMLIGRVMFLYHYETALIFSIIAIAFFVELLKPKLKILTSIIILVIAFFAFIYWSPLTYGTVLNQQEIKELTFIMNGR